MNTTQQGGTPRVFPETMVSHFLKKNKYIWENHSVWLSCFGPRCKKKIVLTVCSQGSSVATKYTYIYLVFLHHLLICRHSIRQPVWLIQVKLDAFFQQVLLHELRAANISPAHTYFSSPDFHIHWGLWNYVIFLSWSFIPQVDFCCYFCYCYCFPPGSFTRAKGHTFLNLDMNFFFYYLKLLYNHFPFLMKAISEQAYAKMFER